MRRSDIYHAKDGLLRKRLTYLNKALRGAKEFPNGLSKFSIEDIEAETKLVLAEFELRKALKGVFTPADLEETIARSDALNRHVVTCPSCCAVQVQLMSNAVPAQWKCRECKTKFVSEPAK